ncbi:autotransporter outer membrane beta-barrel domain-containing protein [Phascolarctobacterium faecium]|uniref:autotransporter outer membrane beta-barrel domain-containing protein n=1 Tax=Phascolarctobacterium faecium TaxID=33025 RepID=UPI003AB20D5C
MNKRVLRKKVLSTLLTMSCVYLGGTSVLPMAEASMVDGNTVHGVVKSYSDNSTLTGANIVIYAGSGETTDITAEGKLKLENTSANVPVIGTVSSGKINLNGDTITVENTGNDYSNSVVFAESGSNITFNNDTTNIISSTNNGKKFIGGAGNIVFSDTATTLNIGNMNESSSISGCIGITVSGQGSFAFNNTDGIVNIGGFTGTVFDMSGGTIKLEGAETNVSSNGGFLLYLSNQRYGGTQNKIDFNSQKTTIKGTSKGIYADTNSINNHVSFKGDVDIEVQGNGYYDGIAVALGANAALDLNFDKGATIKAHQNSAADDLFAVNLAAGSDLKIKGDIDLISTAVGGGTGNNYGLYSNGGTAVFDGMALVATGGKNIYGIYGWNGGQFTFNKDVSIVVEQGKGSIYGVYLNGNNADFKNLVINANNAEGSNAYGIFARGNSKVKIDGDTVITAAGNNGEFAENSMAIRIRDAEVIADGALKAVVSGGETAMGIDIVAIDGSGVFATGTTGMTDISVKNGSEGSYGISLESDVGKKVTADFNNAANITVSGAKDVFGIKGWNSSSGDTEISFKENTVITAQGTEGNNSTGSTVSAISLENSGGNISFDKNALVQVTADNKAKNSSGLNLDKGTAVFNGSFTGIRVKSNGVNSYGIKNNNSGDVDVMGVLAVDVQGQDKVFGIHNASGGKIDIMGITVINANSESKTAQGIYSTGVNSSIVFKANTILTTNGANAVQADSGATIIFDKGLVSENSAYIFAHGNNSSIKINNEGSGLVKIIGNLYAQAGGTLDFKMDNSESYLEGFTDGVNMDMQNGATWRVTGNSSSKNLNLENATVDLTADGASSTVLAVADYSGTGGSFIMDTDLASEADGDKINITTANAGTTYVQVKDASLVNGIEVTGNKNLLLITDASENINFVGKNLNAGGLWDVTPTIENGLTVTDADGNVIGTADQWYLTKIAKAVNNDSQVLLDAVDNSYALWRNTNDSLRKRLGELRFRTNETDGDGIWARYTSGKFSGSGFDSSYNMYQLGYDKADNAKSTYGFAVDSGTGHANYASGGGKDKMTALSVYGTWTGEKGNYTDVVARVGQFDTDVDSYGDYPDKASYKNRAYSLSVEYGKRIELSKERGTFIEPQAQLIIGRLGSCSYTTDRGTAVAVEGMNSAIARLGVVAGKKINDGSDIYFKASALHEFAGERDISMRAANGEVLTGSNDYGDTWFELGLGGNIKLGNSSHLYGDIERSFGADIQKKWQINAGVRFEF